MQLDDLNSLKLAIDTNNPGFYHGNMDDALSELVDELIGVHAELEKATEFDVENVSELVGLYKGALNEVAKLEEDKGSTVMEVDFATCKVKGIECFTGREKVFENNDADYPVKIIIREEC